MDFERNQNPKAAIGIGLFSKRDFENLKDAKTWLMQNHVSILGLDGLCQPYPTSEQFDELRKYTAKYITVSEEIFHDQYSSYIVDGVAQLYSELNEIREIDGKRF